MNEDTVYYSIKIEKFRGLLIYLQDSKRIQKAWYSKRMENDDDKNCTKDAWVEIVEGLSTIETWLKNQYQFPNWILCNRTILHRNPVVNYSLMLEELASECSSIYGFYSDDPLDFINYESIEAFAYAKPMAYKWNNLRDEINGLIAQLANNYYEVDWKLNFPYAKSRDDYYNQKDQYEDQKSDAAMEDMAQDGLNEFYEGFDEEYLGED